MRNFILIILLSAVFPLKAQTYAPDESFGTNGVLNIYPYSTESVIDINYINGKYYLLSGKNFRIINSTGTEINLVNIDFVPFNAFHRFTGIKYVGNNIFIYGNLNTNATSGYDIFICKLSLNGEIVQDFGINGIKKIDFGAYEDINNLVIDNVGNLYCCGTRYTNDTANNSKRVILFKIDSTSGALNFGFDPMGYKEYNIDNSINAHTSDGFIAEYNDNYMIASYASSSAIVSSLNLMLLSIDDNGSIVTSFGESGKRLLFMHNGFSTIGFSVSEDKIFINYTNTSGLITVNGAFIYDLSTNQTLLTEPSPNYTTSGFTSIRIIDNKIHLTKTYNAQTSYNLIRKNLSGQDDTSFHYNGWFSANVPTSPISIPWAIAKSVNKADGNNYIIAGNVVRPGETESKILLLKITPTYLNTDNFSAAQHEVYPLPFEDHIFIRQDSKEIKNITIYDTTGRAIVIPNYSELGDETRVNLSSINYPGVYVLELTTFKNKIYRQKIVRK